MEIKRSFHFFFLDNCGGQNPELTVTTELDNTRLQGPMAKIFSFEDKHTILFFSFFSIFFFKMSFGALKAFFQAQILKPTHFNYKRVAACEGYSFCVSQNAILDGSSDSTMFKQKQKTKEGLENSSKKNIQQK